MNTTESFKKRSINRKTLRAIFIDKNLSKKIRISFTIYVCDFCNVLDEAFCDEELVYLFILKICGKLLSQL